MGHLVDVGGDRPLGNGRDGDRPEASQLYIEREIVLQSDHLVLCYDKNTA